MNADLVQFVDIAWYCLLSLVVGGSLIHTATALLKK